MVFAPFRVDVDGRAHGAALFRDFTETRAAGRAAAALAQSAAELVGEQSVSDILAGTARHVVEGTRALWAGLALIGESGTFGSGGAYGPGGAEVGLDERGLPVGAGSTGRAVPGRDDRRNHAHGGRPGPGRDVDAQHVGAGPGPLDVRPGRAAARLAVSGQRSAGLRQPGDRGADGAAAGRDHGSHRCGGRVLHGDGRPRGGRGHQREPVPCRLRAAPSSGSAAGWPASCTTR